MDFFLSQNGDMWWERKPARPWKAHVIEDAMPNFAFKKGKKEKCEFKFNSKAFLLPSALASIPHTLTSIKYINETLLYFAF